MPETESGSPETSNAILLEGKASLAAAVALAASARRALAGSGDVEVRCAALESIDTRIVQVLLVLERELQELGRALRMIDVPGSVLRLLAVAGLSALVVPSGGDGRSHDAE